MKKSVLLFLACSVLLLAACQKTPESVMDGNVLRAKSSNDLLVESLVSAPADNGRRACRLSLNPSISSAIFHSAA